MSIYHDDEGDCRNCDGTGEIIDSQDNEQTCPECGGSGWVNEELDCEYEG